MALDILVPKGVIVFITVGSEVTMRLIRLKEVLHKTGLSKATVYRLIAVGDFPSSVTIANRAVGWEESLVDEYLMRKVSQHYYRLERAEVESNANYVDVKNYVPAFLMNR